jgi:hypothetical protein
MKISEISENISHTSKRLRDTEREKKVKPGTDEWFKLWFSLPYLKESSGNSYMLQLERDNRANMLVLHILNKQTGKRTEVRGKLGYETNGYDPEDKLHQLLDKIGKSASVSDLMNGDVVSINPRHPQGPAALKVAHDITNEERSEAEMADDESRKLYGQPWSKFKELAQKLNGKIINIDGTRYKLNFETFGWGFFALFADDIANREPYVLDPFTMTLYSLDDTRHERPLNNKETQDVKESNPFTDARMNAIKAGKTEFKVGGKTYKVTGDTSDEKAAAAREGLAEESGKEMLKIFRGMHHDAGMNKDMDRFILAHDWQLGNFTPDMFPSEEEFFDYDDPFDRIVDIDYSYRVNLSAPIIVGPQFSDGKYSVIDGNHRAAAAQRMGKTIKAYFPVKKTNEARTFAPQQTPMQDLVNSYLFFTSFGQMGASDSAKSPSSAEKIKEVTRTLSQSHKNLQNLDKQTLEKNKNKILTHIHDMMNYAIAHFKEHLTPDNFQAKRKQINDILTKYNNLLSTNENVADSTNANAAIAKISESLDQPYPYSWGVQSEDEWAARARTESGAILDIRFEYGSWDAVWDIEFLLDGGYKATAAGDQFRIFATVVKAIKEWWKLTSAEGIPVNTIRFSADKLNKQTGKTGSREKLYNRFAQQFANSIGFTIQSRDKIDATDFELINPNYNEHKVSEAVEPNFDFEWEEAERYPEFVKIGKAAWIELANKGKAVTIKSAKGINNTDAADPDSFKSLDKDKQARALAQLKSGDVEMPIVAVYPDGWKELIGGNTRLTAMLAQDGNATVWVFKVPDEVAELAENFADGKKPGRKGLAKRMGVNTKASVSSLRKTAKNSSGEKQRMAHWLANMKAGREK